MQRNKCQKIKDLEKRAKCLEQKYKELTAQLEKERDISMISDEPGNYFQILQERVFILKQMDITRAKIQRANHSIRLKKRNGQADVGALVMLENHTHCLRINIVQAHEADPTKGHISEESPIGKAVLGREIGEKIEVSSPNGVINYTIKGIS